VTEPGQAHSALNLRAVLATFGLVTCLGTGILALLAGAKIPGLLLLGLAVTAVVDLVVIGRRRRREPHQHDTLFE
jgi:hypothetical protein